MHRIFWGASLFAWALLVASAASGQPTISASLLVLGLVQLSAWVIVGHAYRRIRGVVRLAGWPESRAAQADKSRQKTRVYVIWGLVLMAATLGTRGRWQTGLASATLAFHLGALAAEGFLIAALHRLLREYQARGVAERSA